MQQGPLPGEKELQELRSIAQSDAARQLFSSLQKTHAKQLNTAMEQLKRGDYSAVQGTLSQLMSQQELHALAERLKGSQNG